MAIGDDDLARLGRCVELAREALDDGDEPFGSILVDDAGRGPFEDRNRVKDGDATRHPEFAIARWAADNLTPQSGPPRRCTPPASTARCVRPAHAWVGLGRIVYATSSEQLTQWLTEWGCHATAGGPAADHHHRARASTSTGLRLSSPTR